MAKAIDTLSIRLEFKEGSGSQQIIDKIGKSIKELKTFASATGPSIDKVRRSVNEYARQGNKSISTIEGQVTALRALRREADINSKEFKELTADIAKYERQLNKAQGRRGGGGARQATQVAGAVISGGIFGGPEGAIGGALGAFGGVQGAFAGAAIGAQVGNIRKSIGDAADYAAQIGKLKIALEGVVPNQDDFNSALETASQATQQLNVPQEQAVRGITRLAAAVTGAGGPVGDAETTFKNVTAAIKATGGSSEDVKGAITAMVQVFSKGKVSAEELSGQLGERLPGAVTLFAKANKMTLPELQKNLKAGTVGLNELMKFIEQLGVEFDGTAKTIAGSNEEAGARLSVAFDEMRASVGNSLLETGANFQNAFAEFITDLTPKVVTGIELIKGSVSGFMKVFLPAAAGITTFILLVKGAAIIATLGGIAAAIAALVLKIKILSAGLATVGILLATNPLFLGIAAVSGIVAGIVAITNAINGQAAATERLVKAGKSDTATADDKQKALSELTGQAAEQRRIIRQNPKGLTGQGSAAQNKRRRAAEKELRRIERDIVIVTRVKKKPDKEDPFDYGDPSTDPGGDSGSTDKTQARIGRADEIVRKLQDQLNIQKAKSKVGEFLAKQAKERSDLEAKFQALLKDGANKKIEEAQAAARGLLDKKQALELEKRTKEVMDKATKPLEDMNKSLQEKIRYDKEYKKLIAEGVNPELAKQLIEINKLFEAGDKKLQQRILDLEAQKAITGLSEKELQNINDQIEAIERRRAALKGDKEGAEGSAGEAYADPSFMDSLRKGMNDLYNEATNLNELIANVGVNAVNSFADAFVDLALTGKASFAELTASILKDLARIIMKAAILQAVKAFIPGLFANGGVTQGASSYTPIPGSVTEVAANGLAVAKNGIVPYAKGGLVTKPTLFQYKQGGVGSYGLMGEAGTEAIMPLRRGANGKLGVEASGSGVGNVIVNVDAAGSSVEGDASQADKLGKAIGIAVQQELVKQKRPGGLLSR